MRVGPLGALLAALTFAAALLVMLLLAFGKILLISAAVSWVWPRIFSSDFTRVVFGSDRIPFWKVLVLVTVAALVFSWARRRWRRPG